MSIIKSRYYFKLLIQILAVAIIPTAIIGLVLGIRLYKAASQRTEQIEKLALRQTISKVEEQLKSVQVSMLQFCVQQDTMRAMRTENLIDDFESYNRLVSNSSALMLSYYSGMRIDGISVISNKNNWVYDSDMGYQTLQNKNEGTIINKNINDGWVIEKRYSQNSYFKYEVSNYVLTRYLSMFNVGVIAAKINYNDFSTNFDLFNFVSQMFIINKDGNIIYDGTRDNLNMSAENMPFFSFLKDDEGQFTYEFDMESYEGNYQKSSEFGWTYILTRKVALTNDEIFGSIATTFLLSLFIIIMTTVFVYLLSHKLYQPVYSLYQSLDPVVCEKESHKKGSRFDELQVIQSSVSRLIGDNRQLHKQLGDQRELMHELMIYRLFTGHIQSENDYNMLTLYNISLPWESKALVGIKIVSGYSETNENQMQDVYFVGIIEIINNLLSDNTLVAPIMIDNLVVFVIGKDGEDFQSFCDKSVQLVNQQITSYLKISVQIALSSRFNKISQISQAFDKIKRLLRYQNNNGKSYISAEEVAANIHYPDKTLDDIIKGVKIGDIPMVENALDTFMKNVFLYATDGYQQQFYMMWLIGDILRLVPDYSGYIVNQAASSSQEDLIQVLFNIESLEEKESWLINHIIKPVSEILHTNDANKLFLVKRMVAFINDNTQNSGDIEACASSLNYNSTYLRKIFKNKMGISYSQYAVNFILGKAKVMLVSTDLPISSIAQELGYSNSQNFIRHFKKEFGLTPGQYRSGHK